MFSPILLCLLFVAAREHSSLVECTHQKEAKTGRQAGRQTDRRIDVRVLRWLARNNGRGELYEKRVQINGEEEKLSIKVSEFASTDGSLGAAGPLCVQRQQKSINGMAGQGATVNFVIVYFALYF